MPLNLAQKQEIVEATNSQLANSTSVIVADFRGMTVSDMTRVRKQARDSGITLRVIRNNLVLRAAEGTPHECIKEVLTGPSIIAFSDADPGASARLLKKVQEEIGTIEIKGISLGGPLIAASELAAVAALPTKDEAIARLLSVMKAPLSKMAQVLQAVPSKLVRTLVAVKDQKSSDE